MFPSTLIWYRAIDGDMNRFHPYWAESSVAQKSQGFSAFSGQSPLRAVQIPLISGAESVGPPVTNFGRNQLIRNKIFDEGPSISGVRSWIFVVFVY
jgi:hypothetical protein